MRKRLTAGQLIDILMRARSVIETSEGADEHTELIIELRDVEALISREIGASHMGTGADIVVIGEEVARG